MKNPRLVLVLIALAAFAATGFSVAGGQAPKTEKAGCGENCAGCGTGCGCCHN